MTTRKPLRSALAGLLLTLSMPLVAVGATQLDRSSHAHEVPAQGQSAELGTLSVGAGR